MAESTPQEQVCSICSHIYPDQIEGSHRIMRFADARKELTSPIPCPECAERSRKVFAELGRKAREERERRVFAVLLGS